jgi:hypothetical protein
VRQAGWCSRPGDYMFLIPEPEAAAVASLSDLIGKGVDNQVNVQDCVIICDCGGKSAFLREPFMC